MLSLAVVVLVAVVTPSVVGEAQCQSQLNAWCNSAAADCAGALKPGGCNTTLIALRDTDVQGGPAEYRCYSPDALTPDHQHYDTHKKSSCYCTRDSELEAVEEQCKTGQVNVFTAGVDQPFYGCFRIPALTRLPNGDLLAFSEGRHPACEDHQWNDAVMKKSTDGGQTWSAVKVVHSESKGSAFVTIGNPAPVYSQTSGKVILPLCRDNRAVLMLDSADGGDTWSAPRDLNATLPDWTWVATGPPGGVQLPSGRLLVPADHVSSGQTGSHAMLSDDDGATWQLSSLIPNGNECQATLLPNGSVLMSMRTPQPERQWAVSDTHGSSWAPPVRDPVIAETACEGSIVTLSSGLTVLSSAFASSRSNMTLHVSTDSGASFTPVKTVYAGSAAYSSIVALNATAVGLLYEADGYKRIVYAEVDLTAFAPKHDI